jgi:2-polyprenyl-6-methoxyphenol hydroxylase-like FAD-dependent oxidoreductase
VVLAKCLAGTSDLPAALREYERRRIRRTTGVVKLSANLSKLSRLENPVATAARDRLLTMMFALVAKRAQRRSMAHEF